MSVRCQGTALEPSESDAGPRDGCEDHWIRNAIPRSLTLSTLMTAPSHQQSRAPTYILLSLQCSVSCGQGVRRRNVGCQMGTHKTARETECNPYTRPESERACQAPPCPLYAWRAEEWQEVSRARKRAPASLSLSPLAIITSVPL